jgi:asparagine synthase (glutamine-hydrolysing)
MIFGSIKLIPAAQFQNQVLTKIYNQLSWSDSLSKNFISESFAGFYIYDKNLPQSAGENVFYKDPETGGLVLFEGYLYNKPEIQAQLKISDKKVTTAELILRAYEKWGITFAENLNGDFAICIHFEYSNQVILLNDHLGIRPVAFSVIGSVLYFGTDVIGLSKALFDDEKIDGQYLINFFLQEGYNYSILPHKNLSKLKPGHYIKITSDQQECKQYWHPENIKKDTSLSFPKVAEELGFLLNDAVNIRADRNFTASAHISGGLDSSLVGVLARKIYAEQPFFYGFSWSPETAKPEIKFKKDERLNVKKLCEQNNIIPVFNNFDEDDYLAFLSNWRHPSEYIYEKKTLEAAGEKGINLIFSGWGGDEFISIGEVGIDADLIREFNWNKFLRKYPVRHFRKFSSALLYKGLFPSVRRSFLMYKSFPEIYPYLKQCIGNNQIPRKERLSSKSRRTFHLQLLKKYSLTARTTDWYVHGQRNGIEYRYPLLDRRIVEFMLKVPSKSLVNGSGNRMIIRTLGKGYLPDEILFGTKNDPVNYYHFESVTKNTQNRLLEELYTFQRNPELNFIDFERLEKTIKKLNNGEQDSEIKNDLLILHYLKKAHEFTKGYYSKDDPLLVEA